MANVAARPWDRDAVDRRILRDGLTGAGHVIDDGKDVGGYLKT
jgi:hypothetical protein